MPVTPKQAVSLRILALQYAIEAHKKIDNSSRGDQLDARKAILDTASHFEALFRAPLEEPQVKAVTPVVGTFLGQAMKDDLIIALNLLRGVTDRTDAWRAERNRVIATLTTGLNLDLSATDVSPLDTETPAPPVAGTLADLADPAVAHDLIIALQLLKAGRHAPTIGNLPDAAEDAHDWAHDRDRVVGTLTEAFSIDLTATDGVERAS